ncbi:MAG: selenide, water dikinase SelD [Rhodobacteraceae bacterium]|nr:selenide, water dikinase SelD [Paracoccaceae bacterium]
MQAPLPLTRDLVLIGGGHTHALVARMWGMKPLAGTRVTIINPGPTAPYSGMLPGHIAGHYSRQELDIDLVQLARFAGARLILGAATAIDPVNKVVHVEGRGDIGYDVASIDVGIHAEMPDLPGFAEHATGAKPLDQYATRWRAFLSRAVSGEVAPEVAVIGGGVAGMELALAMAHALKRDVGHACVSVIEAGTEIAGRNRPAATLLARAAQEAGVTLHVNAEVAKIGAQSVMLTNGTEIASRFTVGAAGAFAHGWLAHGTLPMTQDGFVKVDANLGVEGYDGLFAVGDCAHMSHAPRPKAGVFAVRAAPVLRDNLIAALSGGDMVPFRPQKDYLKLISLGGKQALAEKWGRTISGPGLWGWKNRIDQKFMEQFRSLPKMKPEPLPVPVAQGVLEELHGTDKPLCAGCGSKVAPGALGNALAGLPSVGREDVLSGPGDDAAILAMGGTKQVLTTDHLRAFTEDTGLFARVAALHALGDIWAMGAQPQAALVSITLPRMSEALQRRSMAEIMRAAQEVFGPEGAEIVGGHSTMGAEMTLGFTLTGLCKGAPITNAGAKPGDALILTRPLGSGVLLAAEMLGEADGRDIAALLKTMATPQGNTAACLAGAHAMTDVTGFGLAGHLQAICRASGVGAEIFLDDLPIYEGALDLAEEGHRSSIHDANMAAAPVVNAHGARAIFLHDPQTAGGLLAAVPQEAVATALQEMRAAGHAAAVIGTIVEGAPEITCRGS